MMMQYPKQSVVHRVRTFKARGKQRERIKEMASSDILAAIHHIELRRLEYILSFQCKVTDKMLELTSQFPIEYFALCKEGARRNLIFRGEFMRDSTGLEKL